MKRFCLLLLVSVTVLAMSTVAFAMSGITYSLDELGMSIDIPSEYIVFTREIADDDPNLFAYGLSRDDLSDLMESNSIYLNAWDEDADFEIIVTMVDSTMSDFNLVNDTFIEGLIPSFKSEYADKGITVRKQEIYQHDQAKFIKFYINQLNGTDKVYGLQYYTVYDSKAINVTMQSYQGRIDSDKEAILKSIVDTIHFDKEPLLPETLPDTEAFVYRDEEAGVEFTVPDNWTQAPFVKDREYLTVKFASNKKPELSMIYGCTDIWAEMTLEEKAGLLRSDINNAAFSPDDIVEAMGLTKNKISTVSYGGKEYYKCIVTGSSSAYGIDIELTITYLVRFENGYLYMFQFFGDSEDALYADFESLVESVQYPPVKSASSINRLLRSSLTSMLTDLLAGIVVASVAFAISRLRRSMRR